MFIKALTLLSIWTQVGISPLSMLSLRVQGLAFGWHMVLRRLGYKLLPSIVGEPAIQRMVQGKIPFRAVLAAVRKDVIWLALPFVATAIGLLVRGR